MKLINLIWIVAFILSSCSKDENENNQIILHYSIINNKPNPIENNQINILFPTSDKIQLIIMGGDGNYTVSNSDEIVVDVRRKNNFIDITPISIGSSIITVIDNSGNSYTLNIKVHYRELNLKVDKQDIIVIGDKLSETQKAEIEQKVALTLPVKINGGFSFIYDLNDRKGHVLIFKEKISENGIESVFEEKYTETDSVGYRSFVIQIDGKEREFILNRYDAPKSKSDMIEPMAFIEILTNQFKTEYPNVQWVYTQQRIK